MRRPHPASLLLLGLAALVAASSRDGTGLVACALSLALAALILAPLRLRALLRRSRWLLLTLLVLFGWLTPGTPVAHLPGASSEGLQLAVENLSRLLIALCTVALILQALTPVELVAGVRALLAPLALLKVSRDRIAVRLALTLDAVEAARGGARGQPERPPSRLALPATPPGAADLLLGALSALLLAGAWLT